MRTLLATLGAALLMAAPAQAATFTVTTTADGSTCDPTTCTLRGAIAAAVANGTAEPDQIVLGEGVYVLNSSLDMTQMGPNATGITITGQGANRTSIQPVTSGSFRVLTTATNVTLTLRNLTVRNGRVVQGSGGNLAVTTNTALTLDGVRVTGGQAGSGGGIFALTGTTVTIANSVIDTNVASGSGGAIRTQGALNVSDSTIALNRGGDTGGIYLDGAAAPTSLRGVTLARNTTTSSQPPRAGGISSSQSPVTFQGSIIAGNLSTQRVNGTDIELVLNCGIPEPVTLTDAGGNIEDAGYCRLNSGTYTDPQLATALDGTLQPPALPIAATSRAIDVADCAGRTLDQRGLARPQGARCDAGAFEVAQQVQPPTFTPVPTPTPTPQAVVNKTIVVAPVRGTVTVKVPGAKTFEDLDVTKGIPVGSTVDTRKGRVRLTSIPKAGAPPETAEFYDGLFKVTQSRGITTLTLTEQLAPCPKGRASAAAKKPKTRKLWGSGKGKFRTAGKYSAATVRGTQWLVQDSCAGTLTRVTQGSVRVRDNVKRRTIVLRAGKRYTARPRR